MDTVINSKIHSMASIGKDLATIRKHLGMSIEDIQNATKIPLDTLKAIENDSIFEDSDEIQTYIRSFVRTYGRKLKLDDDLVVEALDRHEVGGYSHQLLRAYPELAPDEPSELDKSSGAKKSQEQEENEKKPEPEKPDLAEESEPKKELSDKEPTPKASPSPTPSGDKSKVTAGQKEPNVRNVNWADMGKKFSKQKNGAPVQLIGIGVIAIFIIAIAYFVFTSGDSGTDQNAQMESPSVPEETVDGQDSGIPLNLSDAPEPEPEVPAELSDTLYATIYAASDRLDPIRVWSDLKPRIDPYWIEQGTALNFEFSDTLRFRGQYSRMLVFLNGHRVDNFRQQYFNAEENSVELTRDIFEDDPKWASPIPFELPPNVEEPDSVANRPSF